MVREGPVRLEEAADGVDREAVEDGRSIAPAMPLAASMTTRSGPDRPDVDEGQDLVDEAG